MAAQGGAVSDPLRDQFVSLLLANLDPADVTFLTRISILDLLHPELCRTVAQTADAGERLARLARDTPVFAAGEASDWLRMHTLARDELRRRFALLPAAEQAALHARAAEGLAAQGLIESAALHALAAGQRETAYDLAERSLYESLMTRGHQGAVLEWLSRLPAEEVDRRPRLLLAVAWSLALSERHDEANHFIERILAQPDAGAALRCECALIQSGAAVYADDPDLFAALHDPWALDDRWAAPEGVAPLGGRDAAGGPRGLRHSPDRSDVAAGPCQSFGVPHAAGGRACARAPAPAAGTARRARSGPGLPRSLGRLHRWSVVRLGRPGAAGREAAAPDAGARRGRPRPAQPLHLHDGGGARGCTVGAQPS